MGPPYLAGRRCCMEAVESEAPPCPNSTCRLRVKLSGWWACAWDAGDAAQQRDVLILFGVNAVFHLAWSPLFFKLQRPDWALIEVPFLWASVLAMLIGLWPIDSQAALLILPYLAWVAFAASLNWKVVDLNPS